MKNVALVGYGYWGPNFARVIAASSQANLTWCCDISNDNLLAVKNRYPNVKTTTQLNDVLQDKDVECIIIVVPAKEHYKIAKQSLLAGKDVLIEKPMTATLDEAKELMEIALKYKRILMSDHIFLFNPAIRMIKKMLKDDTLGKIYYGHGTYTALGPIRIDVSAMWDLSIHFIYTFCYLLDSYPTAISAVGRSYLTPNNPDVAFLNVEFGKNVIFNLKVSWIDPARNRSLILVGDKKMVVFDDSQTDKIAVYDRGVLWAKQKSTPSRFIFHYGDIVLPHLDSAEPLAEAFNEFIKCVDLRQEPYVTLKEAVNVVGILEAAQYSLGNSGIVVPLKYNKRNGLVSFKYD